MRELHRNNVSKTHPVFGRPFYRKLEDHEVLQPGDETACLSTLLSLRCDEWVVADWADGITTVTDSLKDDADADERVYRRAVCRRAVKPPHFEVYNKDPECFLDRETLKMYRVSRSPGEVNLTGGDLDLELLVIDVVDGLNRLRQDSQPRTLAEIEREHIFRVLEKHAGDKPAAAAELGICLKTLYNKLNARLPPEERP